MKVSLGGTSSSSKANRHAQVPQVSPRRVRQHRPRPSALGKKSGQRAAGSSRTGEIEATRSSSVGLFWLMGPGIQAEPTRPCSLS